MSDIVPKRKLFRLVEGQLIRVPGDKRDPARLYRSVSNVATGDQYDVELTEQEEKERRAQAAAWEAEAPKREAEAKEREKKEREFRESLVYEQRIVAFLDILGWRNAIKRSLAEPSLTRQLGVVLNLSASISQMFDNLAAMGSERNWHGDPQITHFSDSILLSVKDSQHAQMNLTHNLWAIVQSMLQLGYLLRGGISRGLLIHRGAMAYGPALNLAYDLEHNQARFPRIILDEVLGAAWGEGLPVHNREGKFLGRTSAWRRDHDGCYFYDFLQPLTLMPGVDHGEEFFRQTLMPTRAMVLRNLEGQVDERILEKYVWCADYFNEFCAEHAPYIPRIPSRSSSQ